MPLGVHGVRPRSDHVLSSRRAFRHMLQALGQRPAFDGHARTVQDAIDQKHLQNLWRAARTMKIDDHIAPRWLEAAQRRYFLAYAPESIERRRNAGPRRKGAIV